MFTDRKIVLVTRKTRLMALQEKYCTLGQAKFYLEHLGESFDVYADEHRRYQQATEQAAKTLTSIGKVQQLERDLLPTYLFHPTDIIVVLGQDGLVANSLKYLDGQPVIAVNPMPDLFDGILLPFQLAELSTMLLHTLDSHASNSPVKYQSVTLAEATTNLGDRLLAVNDLFIGPQSHTSARYQLRQQQIQEEQCSSGIIVSTGLGSTGWMKSIVIGANAISHRTEVAYQAKAWDSRSLTFAVREPFPSATSQCSQIFGEITPQTPLQLTSRMAESGVIFSDGIEHDAISFNAGTVATITISDKAGSLVVG
ncbi:hypothetical protein [Photobacterium nomapromontoriensis]|uniref:hypothetical protein n=1 Tax=Photobacterium nomapromontoriensis TaxID=2910237 RepID=UPI003D1137CB